MENSFLNSNIGFIAQIQEERARQIRGEGFNAAHDDQHTQGEIAQAAALYALPDSWRTYEMVHRVWPWHPVWWKPAAMPDRPQSRQRELIKAAALLYAEWDRLERHILRINGAPTDTLAAAAIAEPEDIAPDHPFYNLIKKAYADKKNWDCEACEIEAEDRQVKQKPRHTCGKDGPNDLHEQEFKKTCFTREQFKERIKRNMERANDPEVMERAKKLLKPRFQALNVLVGIYEAVKDMPTDWVYYDMVVQPLIDYMTKPSNAPAIQQNAEDNLTEYFAKYPVSISWDYNQKSTEIITARAWYDEYNRLHLDFDQPLPKPDDPERFT